MDVLGRVLEVVLNDTLQKIIKQNIFNPYYEYFYLLLDTGARRNELLGLQWINIDFKLFRINIELCAMSIF